MPAPSSSQNKPSKAKGSKTSTLRMEQTGPPAKKLKPLSQLSKPPLFDLGSSQPSQRTASQNTLSKGKGKEKIVLSQSGPTETEELDDRLWVDIYEPTTEAELAVHVRKVRDVRQWLTEAFDENKSSRLRKYRRILALSGPAGTAKTATIRVLARELDIKILEWRNATEENFTQHDDFDDHGGDRLEYVGLNQKFQTFLARAANCHSVFGPQQASSLSQSSQSSSAIMGPPRVPQSSQRQLVLLEDLPNLLHPPTQQSFHSAVEGFVTGSSLAASPIVIIVSDAGVRGETGDDASSTVHAWRGKEAMDIRTVIPPSLLRGPFVVNITFNPIAPTLMKRALQDLLTKHFSKREGKQPSKEMVDLIVESSNGDIRSAIMTLQFACSASYKVVAAQGQSKSRRTKTQRGDLRPVLEATTRREQSLALFHLVGKILYNKRKGDAPAKSTSAKDAQKERDLDAKLIDPLRLPSHLSEHDRKAIRVDIDALYADSPVDSSLLSLYIHQNYTQYCDEIDECDGVIDWLSWVDSSGGDSWLQANPHRFHLITLGTVHSLPTPVERRNQKAYKPEFFDVVKRTHNAEDGLEDVQGWLRSREDSCSNWTRRNIALELGGVLKAFDSAVTSTPHARSLRAPPTHHAFSRLEFVPGAVPNREIVDEADAPHEGFMAEDELIDSAEGREDRKQSEAEKGGWLEEDDIEDF